MVKSVRKHSRKSMRKGGRKSMRKGGRKHMRKSRRSSIRRRTRSLKGKGLMSQLTKGARQLSHLATGNRKFVPVEQAISGLTEYAKKTDPSGMRLHYFEGAFDNFRTASGEDKINKANNIINLYNKNSSGKYIEPLRA